MENSERRFRARIAATAQERLARAKGFSVPKQGPGVWRKQSFCGCSTPGCIYCANPRRTGAKHPETIQELRHLDIFKEGLSEALSPEESLDIEGSAPSKPSNVLDAEALVAYAKWAEGRWLPSPDIDPVMGIAVRDLSIMTLGFGGETGEVADELQRLAADPDASGLNLKKELGDTFYYWTRIGMSYELDLPGMFFRESPVARDEDLPALQPLDEMVSAVGLVQEAVKKHIRDGYRNTSKVEAGLVRYAQAWRRLCILHGLAPKEVLDANVAKIEGRAARGVMRGSGDER